MASSSLTLAHFIQAVPVCEVTTPLATVVSLIQSNQQQTLAIVSQEGCPLGVMHAPLLGSHLAQNFFTQEHQFDQSSDNASSLTQARQDLTHLSLKALMEPVIAVPARIKVSELGAYLLLETSNPPVRPIFALVDQEGKFLGLLNYWSLLQYLGSIAPKSGKKSLLNPLNKFQHFVFQFLEQFPLPLMVQTEQGQVLHRNWQWNQQLGDYIFSATASVCLFQPGENLTASAFVRADQLLSDFNNCAESPSENSSDRVSRRLQLLEEPETSSQASLNPPKRVTSITGSDKVWQFIKLPLNFWHSLSGESSSSGDQERSLIWLVLATDVTEQYHLCQELGAKNNDLVHLNRLKDEFLACISHELKSPLTAVVGLSSILKDRKVGELNQRQTHYAELIYQSGHQLMSLVNDLLDLTRLETGQLKLIPTSVSIKIACEQAYNAIDKKYKGKTETPIAFTLEIDPELDIIVADEVRLHQMLVHLLDNAVKFTQGKGNIGLRVNHWENWIAFTVWDTGIGIPEEYQHLIFQKFQQLESPLTRQFEGTGLGLVLTQHLARAHGGDISFISQVNRGSQFTLLLPPNPIPKQLRTGKFPNLQDTDQPPTANFQSLVPHLHDRHNPLVLVVETIPRAIDDLTEKLMELGYRIVVARTGTEALDKARRLSPYLIFLNPLLPLLSGWDVLKLLKANPETKPIPIIITGNNTDKSLSQENNADGFLKLPIQPEALQAILPQQSKPPTVLSKSLTILRLYPEGAIAPTTTPAIHNTIDLNLLTQLSQLNHRIVEADDLEQAAIIARVWDVDVVVVDGTILEDPLNYLRSLSEHPTLAALPLVTLDTKTTEVANQVSGLSVFPCLVPANQENFNQFLQVIQIAAGI